MQKLPADPNGLDGRLDFSGYLQDLAVGDSYGIGITHPYACSNPCIPLGNGCQPPSGCRDDIELVSVTCTGIACSASIDSSTTTPSVVSVDVQATESGTAIVGVRVRRKGSGEEWDDRIDLQFYKPTAVQVTGDPIGGDRAFLPGTRLRFEPSLVAADRTLHHDFDASQLQVAGGIALDASLSVNNTWTVLTNAPGPSSLTFEAGGVAKQLAIPVADPAHAVGFELYSSASGSTTTAQDPATDPLAGRQQLTQVVMAHDSYDTYLLPVAVLDDGTRALSAAGLASVTDPRLLIEPDPLDNGQLYLEVDRTKPSGNALVTLSRGSVSASFPVLVE